MADTFTTRLALRKTDPNDLVDIQAAVNANLDIIDARINDVICTSISRPSSPYAGMTITETDTLQRAVYASGQWMYVGAGISAVTSLGAITAPFNGQFAVVTTTGGLYWYQGPTNGWISVVSRVTGAGLIGISDAGSAVTGVTTTETIIGSGITFNALAHRNYKLEVDMSLNASVANTSVDVIFRAVAGSSATLTGALGLYSRYCNIAAASFSDARHFSRTFNLPNTTPTTYTVFASIIRVAGTGSLGVDGSGPSPWHLELFDVGSSV